MTLLEFLDKHFNAIGSGVMMIAVLAFFYFAVYREHR